MELLSVPTDIQPSDAGAEDRPSRLSDALSARIYRWQKEFFENAAAAFEHRSRRPSDDKDRRIALLEQKLQRKHEVLSELMEEHIKLKKERGEL